MLQLTENQKQIFQQAALDGNNKASLALSEMFNVPVKLVSIHQSLLSLDEIKTDFSTSKLGESTIAILQQINGDFHGYSLLPMSRKDAKHIVHMLSSVSADYHDTLSSEECNILTELTNIIGGYLTGSISDSIGINVSATGTPNLQQMEAQNLYKELENIFNDSLIKFLVFESKISVRLGEARFYSIIAVTSKLCKLLLENEEEPESEPVLLQSSKKVLVADNSAFLRKRMVELLVQRGYIVDEVSNGNEVIDKIKSTRYNMVFSDLLMPEVGGMEVLAFMKKSYPDIHVIIVTSKAQQSVVTEVTEAGASGIIFKPLNEKKLDELLEKLAVTQEK